MSYIERLGVTNITVQLRYDVGAGRVISWLALSGQTQKKLLWSPADSIYRLTIL